MKYLAILSLFFVACDTTTVNKDGSVTTSKPNQAAIDSGISFAEQLAQMAIQIAAAKNGVPATSAAAKQVASADLSGMAAQAQAALGKTPVAANVAQGAATPALGSAVQAVLPATPISQQTANTLFDAAAAAKTSK